MHIHCIPIYVLSAKSTSTIVTFIMSSLFSQPRCLPVAQGFFSSGPHPRLESWVLASPVFENSMDLEACCSLRPIAQNHSTLERTMTAMGADRPPQSAMVMLTLAYLYCCCYCRIGRFAARADAGEQRGLAGLRHLR